MLNEDLINKYERFETVCGAWIGGRKLFRTIVWIGEYTIKAGKSTIPLGITNIDNLTRCEFMFVFGGNKHYQRWDGICSGNMIVLNDGESLELNNKLDALNVTKAYVLLEYSKKGE